MGRSGQMPRACPDPSPPGDLREHVSGQAGQGRLNTP